MISNLFTNIIEVQRRNWQVRGIGRKQKEKRNSIHSKHNVNQISQNKIPNFQWQLIIVAAEAFISLTCQRLLANPY